jgi:hypothetical protein
MGALLSGTGEVVAHVRFPSLARRAGVNAPVSLIEGTLHAYMCARVCACMCVCVCVCVHMCVCACVCICVWMWYSVCLSVCDVYECQCSLSKWPAYTRMDAFSSLQGRARDTEALLSLLRTRQPAALALGTRHLEMRRLAQELHRVLDALIAEGGGVRVPALVWVDDDAARLYMASDRYARTSIQREREREVPTHTEREKQRHTYTYRMRMHLSGSIGRCACVCACVCVCVCACPWLPVYP